MRSGFEFPILWCSSSGPKGKASLELNFQHYGSSKPSSWTQVFQEWGSPGVSNSNSNDSKIGETDMVNKAVSHHIMWHDHRNTRALKFMVFFLVEQIHVHKPRNPHSRYLNSRSHMHFTWPMLTSLNHESIMAQFHAKITCHSHGHSTASP